MKKQINKTDSHEFAFYYQPIFEVIKRGSREALPYQLTDGPLCHRISGILRLQEGESCILFDAYSHVRCTIAHLGKKIELRCELPQQNVSLSPHITFLLPLLKREAYETAIYSLAELGANVIQPVITHKAHRSWGDTKEHDRLERIMQAAAEQSKHFALPKLEQPLNFAELDKLFGDTEQTCIFFDPEGKPLAETIKDIPHHNNLMLMVGPEGDLTTEEKDFLQKQRAHFCALTPTVLRAEQAVAIALGSLRSLIR